ncbi:MAG: trypsin-like peptidase domain-containing protein [Pseudomonadota bacterium]|nr:trypsin-like peptidase domain-containing protein [Pseudomonadota bacterium]
MNNTFLPYRKPAQTLASAASLALLLTACGGGDADLAPLSAQASPPLPATPLLEIGALEDHEPVDMKLVQIKSIQQDLAERITPERIALPALPAEKAQPAALPGQPLRIGVARAIAQADSHHATAQLLRWQPTADGGQRAALAVRLEGAQAVRLGLRITQLPPGTQLSVYAPDASQAEQVSASEVLRTLQNNLDAGITGDKAMTYWLPTVRGDEAVLQVQLPAGIDPAMLQMAMPVVSHLLADPAADDFDTKASAACNVDVMCTSGQESRRTAIARMIYMQGGNSYFCSGTLVNNTRQDGTPYFLTAEHCINNQAAASTLETYWHYRSSACNSGQLSGEARRVTGGAQLLWTSARTDATLLRINGALPSGLSYLGWSASTAPSSGSVYGIHHPVGDLQKYSAGALHGFAQCQSTTGNSVSCSPGTASNGAFLVVGWTNGTTEGGSSGSPLFSSSNQIIGQLFAGGGSCGASGSAAAYGRLDWSFQAGLANWLSPSAATPTPTPSSRQPVYRFYNTRTGAHFYTNNGIERDYLIANSPWFRYEGPNFYAYNSQVSGTSPVYRFYNTQTGVHFYTISAAERDHVIAALPAFKYEGPSWHARTAADTGTSPLYRFYSAPRQGHFYTINAAEMQHVRANYPDFSYEGVAYHAWTAQ